MEYQHAHIPGALNVPLFSDEQRAQVGTCYKKVGRIEAFSLGLNFVAQSLHQFLDLPQMVTLYCARGGMRSQSVCKLLQLIGTSARQLPGGYKQYRQQVLSQFEKNYQLKVLAGHTGSGKTRLLHQYKAQGLQVLDLEALACHKGSSFGHIGLPAQPSQEQFENLLAKALSTYNPKEPIWVEDESRLIGTCVLPGFFYQQLLDADVEWVCLAKELRIQNLVMEYGTLPIPALIESTARLKKRLGAVRCQEAIQAIETQNFEKAAEIILEYYDKAYTQSHYGLRAFRSKIST